jgi:DNA primase
MKISGNFFSFKIKFEEPHKCLFPKIVQDIKLKLDIALYIKKISTGIMLDPEKL